MNQHFMDAKKIAVFHTTLDNIGGSEIVALALTREFNADLYTTNINLQSVRDMGYGDIIDRIHSIGKTTRNAPFRQQIALLRFRFLNLRKKYSLYIIAGDWAISAAVNHSPTIWYVHSPLNEIWAFKDFVEQKLLNFWKRPLFSLWVKWNRYLSKKYVPSVAAWVCNSSNTKKRILRYYNHNAQIVYPPTNTKQFYYADPQDYWISVNRLTDHKRVEMQIEAFAKLPHHKLVIIGYYQKHSSSYERYYNRLISSLPPNITLLEGVTQQELINKYSKAIGFIATATNEDFGMTLVEAMASGKPVIAANEGGYRETVINGKTGVLIDDINSEKLASTIEKVSSELKLDPLHYKDACLARAKEFDTEMFVHKMKKVISSTLEKA